MTRLSRSHTVGNTGLFAVMEAFSRIGWGVTPNAESDAGTDVWATATDENRDLLRRVVGIQVKTGPTYFRESTEEEGEDGWWYYESESDHFDDWLNYNVPHLVVLHDPETRVSYWTHVKPSAVRSTGQGRKIFVPASQTIDDEHKAALRDVALSRDVLLPLDGTAVTPPSGAVPPGCELRCALLAPKLVAPHPHSEAPITAAEGVAAARTGAVPRPQESLGPARGCARS